MLKRAIRHTLAALVFLAISLAVYLGAESAAPSFQHCLREYKHTYETDNEARQNPYWRPVVVTRAWAACSARLSDAHGPGITALATILIAAFTLTLWITNGRQLQILRDEFEATHRPRMRVRFFPERPVLPGVPMIVVFEIVNVGDAIGIVTGVELSVYDFSLGAVSNPRFAEELTINKTEFAPGDISPRYEKEITHPNMQKNPIPVTPDQMGGQYLKVRGRVVYRDLAKRERVTQFYRNWDGMSLRVVPDANRDYEYED